MSVARVLNNSSFSEPQYVLKCDYPGCTVEYVGAPGDDEETTRRAAHHEYMWASWYPAQPLNLVKDFCTSEHYYKALQAYEPAPKTCHLPRMK